MAHLRGESELRIVHVCGTIDHSTKTAGKGWSRMDQERGPRYFIVEAGVLPEIYLKVAEAKRLLETGGERTGDAATRRTGLRRSAGYK